MAHCGKRMYIINVQSVTKRGSNTFGYGNFYEMFLSYNILTSLFVFLN